MSFFEGLWPDIYVTHVWRRVNSFESRDVEVTSDCNYFQSKPIFTGDLFCIRTIINFACRCIMLPMKWWLCLADGMVCYAPAVFCCAHVGLQAIHLCRDRLGSHSLCCSLSVTLCCLCVLPLNASIQFLFIAELTQKPSEPDVSVNSHAANTWNDAHRLMLEKKLSAECTDCWFCVSQKIIPMAVLGSLVKKMLVKKISMLTRHRPTCDRRRNLTSRACA